LEELKKLSTERRTIMLYIFMGQSCTGKSTVADKLKELMEIEVFAGKDYLRMAKNENDAWDLFYEKLSKAALDTDGSHPAIVYLVTEEDQLNKIKPLKGVYTVKFIASLATIKSRFAERMRGHLSPPVEKMLERQFVDWEAVQGDMTVDTTEDVDSLEVARSILQS
jgi:gluconate kinase